MSGRLTSADAVRLLGALTGPDPDVHEAADDILLATVDHEVWEAYNRAAAGCKHWGYAP